MADFGIQTLRADGSVMMDGSNKSGIFIEVLELGNAGSKAYPNIPAGQLYYLLASSTGRHIISVDYNASGQAVLSWAINEFAIIWTNTYVMVFARRLTSAETFGISLLSDSGDALADFNNPVPQYITTLTSSTLSAQGAFSYVSGPAGTLFKRTYTVPTTRNNTNRIALLYLPDSSTDDAWYACSGYFKPNTDSLIERVEVYSLVQSTPYKTPTVHLFSLDGPISGGGTFGNQFFTPSGALVYDSSAENVSVKDIARVVTNGNNGAAVSFPLALPTMTGVAAPFYEAIWSSSFPANTVNERYMGMFQRRGSTIYYKIKLVDGTVNGRADANGYEQRGNEQGGGMMVVDVAQLSPQAFSFNA